MPYDVAFRVCLDDVESYVDKFIPKENVLWIADVGHQSDLKMSFNMQQIMSLSSTTAALGLSPDNAFQSHIADTIYFGDSHESRALQLADVCCSVIAGHILNDPVVEPYYEMIRPRLTHEPRILGNTNQLPIFYDEMNRYIGQCYERQCGEYPAHVIDQRLANSGSSLFGNECFKAKEKQS